MKSHRVRSSALAQPFFAIALVAGMYLNASRAYAPPAGFPGGRNLDCVAANDLLTPGKTVTDPRQLAQYLAKCFAALCKDVDNFATCARILNGNGKNFTNLANAILNNLVYGGETLTGGLDSIMAGAFLDANKIPPKPTVPGVGGKKPGTGVGAAPVKQPGSVVGGGGNTVVGAGGTTFGKATQACVKALGAVSTAMTVYDFAKGTLDLAEQHIAWKERQAICQSKKPFWESSAGDFEMNEVPPEDYCTKYKAFQEACKSTGSGLDTGASEGVSSGDYTVATYPYKVQKLDLLCSMPRPSNTAVACEQGAVAEP